MTDGPTEVTDPSSTEASRRLVRSFAEQVLVDRDLDRLGDFVDEEITEHHPDRSDGIAAFRAALSARSSTGEPAIRYERIHRVLAEGDFVLCAAEGAVDGAHSAIHELYRVADGRIVERWGSIEPIPPRETWNNDNGKF